MPLLPIAAFLAGALLTLLLPAVLLTALVVWYTKFVGRVPETGEGAMPSPPPAAHDPRPNPGPETAPPPQEG